VLDSDKVVSDNPKVIERDVSKVWTPCAIPNCPYSCCCGLQALVYPNMSSIIPFDPSNIEPDMIGVRCTARGDQEVGPFNY
jgi:hypothetical protein